MCTYRYFPYSVSVLFIPRFYIAGLSCYVAIMLNFAELKQAISLSSKEVSFVLAVVHHNKISLHGTDCYRNLGITSLNKNSFLFSFKFLSCVNHWYRKLFKVSCPSPASVYQDLYKKCCQCSMEYNLWPHFWQAL